MDLRVLQVEGAALAHQRHAAALARRRTVPVRKAVLQPAAVGNRRLALLDGHGLQFRPLAAGADLDPDVADAVAGTAELDQAASDSIRETVLTDKQNTLYSETIAQWISEAGFKVDLNALK